MIPDAEIVRIMVEAFDSLDLKKDVTVKVNHRKILDGMFEVAGVPDKLVRSISSAVDKLDKAAWSEVQKEMEEKGLTTEVATEVGKFVNFKGSRDAILDFLRSDPGLQANEHIKQGLKDMELFFNYLDALEVPSESVSLELSLARGLDYYTGLIYEAVTDLSAPEELVGSDSTSKKAKPAPKTDFDGEDASNNPQIGIGSIAAGGRYDNLVGMYGKRQIPCVGVSFGVDRIFTLLKMRQEKERQDASFMKQRDIDVFIMSFGGKTFDGLLPARMKIASQLWNAGLKAEYAAKVKPRLPQQFKAAEAGGARIAAILGEDEMAAGQIKLKVLGLLEGDPEKDGRLVAQDDLVAEVKKLLNYSSKPT